MDAGDENRIFKLLYKTRNTLLASTEELAPFHALLKVLLSKALDTEYAQAKRQELIYFLLCNCRYEAAVKPLFAQYVAGQDPVELERSVGVGLFRETVDGIKFLERSVHKGIESEISQNYRIPDNEQKNRSEREESYFTISSYEKKNAQFWSAKKLVENLIKIHQDSGLEKTVATCQQLKAVGVDLDMNLDYTTPLAEALKKKSTAVLQALLESGANPNLMVGNGSFPLLEIILAHPNDLPYKSKHLQCLIEYGADPTLQFQLPGDVRLHSFAGMAKEHCEESYQFLTSLVPVAQKTKSPFVVLRFGSRWCVALIADHKVYGIAALRPSKHIAEKVIEKIQENSGRSNIRVCVPEDDDYRSVPGIDFLMETSGVLDWLAQDAHSLQSGNSAEPRIKSEDEEPKMIVLSDGEPTLAQLSNQFA